MKSFVKKILIPAVVLFALVATVSSCQRGYGCPYKMQASVEVKK